MVLPMLPEHLTRNLLSSRLLLQVRRQRRVKEQQQQQQWAKIKISFFENLNFFSSERARNRPLLTLRLQSCECREKILKLSSKKEHIHSKQPCSPT